MANADSAASRCISRLLPVLTVVSALAWNITASAADLLLEAGLDFNISATATLGVSYSGQYADDVTDNALKGRLTWLF